MHHDCFAPLAALGVGTAALSSIFWVFNFLGIGAQTDVAQASGAGEERRAARIMGMALTLAGLFGLAIIVAGSLLTTPIARALGAEGEVLAYAEEYMVVRLIGAPAVLATLVASGVLRGQQDMRTPLWVALAVNVWIVTDGWIAIRATLGVVRVWPGIGASPLGKPDSVQVEVGL